MLAKSSLLSKRVHLPVVCIAIVFKPRGYRPLNGTFRLEAAGRPTQQLWLREVCLWRTKPEAWWEEQPGLMALYPLCQHNMQPRTAIEHAVVAIERSTSAPGPRTEALGLLSIFAEQAFPALDVERIIGSEKMKESRILRRAREEGELIRQRADIIQALRLRFGTAVSAEFTATLDEMDDLTRLVPLFNLAVTCTSVDEFRAGLQAQRVAS